MRRLSSFTLVNLVVIAKIPIRKVKRIREAVGDIRSKRSQGYGTPSNAVVSRR